MSRLTEIIHSTHFILIWVQSNIERRRDCRRIFKRDRAHITVENELEKEIVMKWEYEMTA